MRIAIALSILVTCCGLLSAQEKVDLPEGVGKPLLVRICSKCHGLENVVRARNTKEKWSSIVDDMVARGSEGTDEELERIIDYLTANFGKDKPAPKVR
jgi:hypothetical protein